MTTPSAPPGSSSSVGATVAPAAARSSTPTASTASASRAFEQSVARPTAMSSNNLNFQSSNSTASGDANKLLLALVDALIDLVEQGGENKAGSDQCSGAKA